MPHPELEDRLYTSSEVAKLLGVSLRSLYRYIKSGKLVPETTTLSGRHRFSKDQVEKFLYPKREEREPRRLNKETSEVKELTVEESSSEEVEETKEEKPKPKSSKKEPAFEIIEDKPEKKPESEFEPIADDGEVIKETEIETAPSVAKAMEGKPAEPEKPLERSETLSDPEQAKRVEGESKGKPPKPPQPEEKPVSEPTTPEELEKLRLEALKKVSGGEPKDTSEREKPVERPLEKERIKEPETPTFDRKEPVFEVKEEPEPKEPKMPDFGKREERILGVKEEEPIPPKPPTPPKEKEGSPLEEFSSFDKKCQYFYSPVGDLKQIAQKVHQFSSNAGKKYAFTLLGGLSLHGKKVPPFSLIHFYLKEADLAFFKGVLKLTPKPKEEANIGIFFEADSQFWSEVKEISNYRVVSDKRLYDDLYNYSNETRELAEGFKSNTQ